MREKGIRYSPCPLSKQCRLFREFTSPSERMWAVSGLYRTARNWVEVAKCGQNVWANEPSVSQCRSKDWLPQTETAYLTICTHSSAPFYALCSKWTEVLKSSAWSVQAIHTDTLAGRAILWIRHIQLGRPWIVFGWSVALPLHLYHSPSSSSSVRLRYASTFIHLASFSTFSWHMIIINTHTCLHVWTVSVIEHHTTRWSAAGVLLLAMRFLRHFALPPSLDLHHFHPHHDHDDGERLRRASDVVKREETEKRQREQQ